MNLTSPKQLLVELRSEQLPAALQKWGRKNLESSFREQLMTIFPGSEFSLVCYSSPCRLTLIVDRLPAAIAVPAKKIKGPLVEKGEQARQGFLHRHLASGSDLALALSNKKEADYLVQETVGGKRYYFLLCPAKEITTPQILEKAIPELLNQLKWPERMFWNNHDLTWVRPLKSVLAVFDQQPLNFKFGHLTSQTVTYGHWRDQSEPFAVTNQQTYLLELAKRHLDLDHDLRKQQLLEQLAAVGIKNPDPSLVEEVAGLVSRPAVLLCHFKQRYTHLPSNLIQVVLAKHQRAFLNPDKPGSFAIVRDWCARPDEERIRKGNEVAVNARLEDARFSWNNDIQKMASHFSQMVTALKELSLHPKLAKEKGVDHSYFGKTQRLVNILTIGLQRLAEAEKAALVDQELVYCGAVAASLAKLDLVTETVREFPSVQGYAIAELFQQLVSPASKVKEEFASQLAQTVNSFYLSSLPLLTSPQRQGLDLEQLKQLILRPDSSALIATALTNQYWPNGQTSDLNGQKLAKLLAAADHADSLLTLLLVCDKPTGAKDPYCLRQHANALVRLVVEDSEKEELTKEISLQSGLDKISQLAASCLRFNLANYCLPPTHLHSVNSAQQQPTKQTTSREELATELRNLLLRELSYAPLAQLHQNLGNKQSLLHLAAQVAEKFTRSPNSSQTASAAALTSAEQSYAYSWQEGNQLIINKLQTVMAPFYELVYHYAQRKLDWKFNNSGLYAGQVNCASSEEQAMGLLSAAKVELFWNELLEEETKLALESGKEQLALIASCRRLFGLAIDFSLFPFPARAAIQNLPVASSSSKLIWKQLLADRQKAKVAEQLVPLYVDLDLVAKVNPSAHSAQKLVEFYATLEQKNQLAAEDSLISILLIDYCAQGEQKSKFDYLVSNGSNQQKIAFLRLLCQKVEVFLDQVHVSSGSQTEKLRWYSELLLARYLLLVLAFPFDDSFYYKKELTGGPLKTALASENEPRKINYRLPRTEQQFIRYLDRFIPAKEE